MRSLNDRIWSDGTRHWYDGMTGGYYMDEGVPGLFADNGLYVPGFERATITNRAGFAALIYGILLTHPEILP